MEAVFKEIVHIMHHDYAGWKDKQGWDRPDYFLGQLKDDNFASVVKEYFVTLMTSTFIFLIRMPIRIPRKIEGLR